MKGVWTNFYEVFMSPTARTPNCSVHMFKWIAPPTSANETYASKNVNISSITPIPWTP